MDNQDNGQFTLQGMMAIASLLKVSTYLPESREWPNLKVKTCPLSNTKMPKSLVPVLYTKYCLYK